MPMFLSMITLSVTSYYDVLICCISVMDDSKKVKGGACSVVMYNQFCEGRLLELRYPQNILYKTDTNLTGCMCES